MPFTSKAYRALNEMLAVVRRIHKPLLLHLPCLLPQPPCLASPPLQVRIQLKAPPVSIFGNLDTMRNELVIRMQPGGRRRRGGRRGFWGGLRGAE